LIPHNPTKPDRVPLNMGIKDYITSKVKKDGDKSFRKSFFGGLNRTTGEYKPAVRTLVESKRAVKASDHRNLTHIGDHPNPLMSNPINGAVYALVVPGAVGGRTKREQSQEREEATVLDRAERKRRRQGIYWDPPPRA
jgi:hypothetical protein